MAAKYRSDVQRSLEWIRGATAHQVSEALKAGELDAVLQGDHGQAPDPALEAANAEVEAARQEWLEASGKVGPIDQGAQGSGSSKKPGQLTREALRNMTPDEINEARKNGQLRDLGFG